MAGGTFFASFGCELYNGVVLLAVVHSRLPRCLIRFSCVLLCVCVAVCVVIIALLGCNFCVLLAAFELELHGMHADVEPYSKCFYNTTPQSRAGAISREFSWGHGR